MTSIEVVPMQPDEAEEASFVLSKAFIDTLFSGKIMGGHTEKHRRMLQLGFKSMISKKPGDKVVAKDGEEIVGVMRMVKWPDCQNSIPRGIETVPLRIIARKVLSRLQESRRIWGVHDPKKPHWHVDPIGILPKRQGQGIGSKLMSFTASSWIQRTCLHIMRPIKCRMFDFTKNMGIKSLKPNRSLV
jgi:ribosomal protein S18 acetylase RimI-like enzyme